MGISRNFELLWKSFYVVKTTYIAYSKKGINKNVLCGKHITLVCHNHVRQTNRKHRKEKLVSE